MRTFKSICATLGLLLLMGGQPVSSQVLDTQLVSAASTGGGCTATANSCASFQSGSAMSLGLSVSGTFTGTLTFEGSIDGSAWTTVTVVNLATGASATTATAAGSFSIANAGFLQVRARATAWTSGTATVSAARGFGLARLFSPTFDAITAATVTGTTSITGGTISGTTIGGTAITASTSITTASVLFAALPASTNGTILYCSDCAVASAPCTGASTGAMAFRVNGAWRCQ